jgi:hypothetical protein
MGRGGGNEKKIRRENMGEEFAVLPLQFVGNTGALRVGEQSESSLRNSLVTQGITTEEDSLVYAKLAAITASRRGSK